MAQDQIQEGASLIFITYQQLINVCVREASGTERVIDDAIIVVDVSSTVQRRWPPVASNLPRLSAAAVLWMLQEAHNLDSDCRDCASIELSLAMLDSHLQKLDEFKKALQDEFGYANVMQIPGLVKVVVNTGVGEAARDSKVIDGAVEDLTKITGQKPVVTKARKSIAQFKLREGQAIGAHVTLRGDRAWEFVDRLVNLALPRIRDFRGLSGKQFDGNGNYTFGLQEQSVFHEIDQDRIDRVRGFDITVVTSAGTDAEGRALLRHLGFPFRADDAQA